jgi:glycosyltransferase 2 family protein
VPPRLSIRAAAPYVGSAVAIACVALVAWQVSRLAAELDPYFDGWGTLAGLVGFAVVYAVSLFLVAFVWVLLIPRAGVVPTARELVRVYGVSSIAKYLPGNVFHFAARQIVGARLGLSHAAMARATAIEALLSVAMALGVALAVTIGSASEAVLRPGRSVATLLVLVLALVTVSLLLVSRRLSVGIRMEAVKARTVLFAGLCSAAFFAISAIIAVATDTFLRPAAAPSAAIGAAYLVAWTVGYVVPGAPGGLGVREATLLGLLASTTAAPGVLALALATRFITTLGDALFAALCAALPARPMPQSLEESRP